MKNEIKIFENQGIKLEVNIKEDTVWLTQAQLSELFNSSRSGIAEHISNIFQSGELDEKTSVGISDKSSGGRIAKVYNLDVIIAVGYRVNSKTATEFRRWATSILKEYLLKGYVINQEKMKILENTAGLIKITTRALDRINDSEIKDVIEVINSYATSLDLLDDYDHHTLNKIKGTKNDLVITYEECDEVIKQLKFNNDSSLFAMERDNGFKSLLNNIYASFGGEEIYKTSEDKCANLLYLTVKDHAFSDGNKRIAATLFIFFLNQYGLLYKNNERIIDNNTLATLTLLIAESNPKEKDMIIDIILNIIAV